MGAVFAFAKTRTQHRPWQNHELAEFYRAIDILGRTGLAVTPDMGVSDEGDPWFAFCRADNGEVLVHLARIDGLIVATSIASDDIVRGAELRNIIDAVLRIRPLGLPAHGADRRLFLHPAVVLTAFIAAALAFSKQAEAHAAQASGGAKPNASHGFFGKFLAGASASAPADTSGSLLPAAKDAAGDQNGLASPIPLAALLAAATAVIGPSSDASLLATPSDAALQQPVGDTAALVPLWSLWTPPSSIDFAQQQDGSTTVSTTSVETLHVPTGDGEGAGGEGGGSAGGTPLQFSLTAADAAQAPPVHFAASGDNADDHVILPPPSHLGLAGTGAAVDQAGSQPSDSSGSSNGGVSISLGAISPVALELLLGTAPVNPVRSDHSAVTTESATSESATTVAYTSSGPAPTAGSSAALPAIPATIVMGANPAQALGQLVEYGLTSHPIAGSFPVSSDLAQNIAFFENGATGPVKLIVFDSSTITMPVFELTQGILFVSDHELGITPAQATPSSVVTVDLANGGTMTLLGVVNTPPTN